MDRNKNEQKVYIYNVANIRVSNSENVKTILPEILLVLEIILASML